MKKRKSQAFDEIFQLMFDIVRSETYELARVDSAEKAEKIARECATELATGLAYEIPAAGKKAVISKEATPERAQFGVDTMSAIIKAAIALTVRMTLATVRQSALIAKQIDGDGNNDNHFSGAENTN